MSDIMLKDENEVLYTNFVKGTRRVTNREKQILVLIASGKTNKEISKDLSLSPSTVRNHISNIFAKLNITNRAQATALAIFSGLLNMEGLSQTIANNAQNSGF